jgi:hypothetical protein
MSWNNKEKIETISIYEYKVNHVMKCMSWNNKEDVATICSTVQQ